MSELWTLHRGNGPVIVNVPHAGTIVPAAINAFLTPTAQQNPDADWHVDTLYRSAAPAYDATLMLATHSRIVVDLNRDPSGDLLYPGASNTEICPLTTFDNEPVYRADNAPGTIDVEARVRQYWQPYHTQLSTEIERI